MFIVSFFLHFTSFGCLSSFFSYFGLVYPSHFYSFFFYIFFSFRYFTYVRWVSPSYFSSSFLHIFSLPYTIFLYQLTLFHISLLSSFLLIFSFFPYISPISNVSLSRFSSFYMYFSLPYTFLLYQLGLSFIFLFFFLLSHFLFFSVSCISLIPAQSRFRILYPLIFLLFLPSFVFLYTGTFRLSYLSSCLFSMAHSRKTNYFMLYLFRSSSPAQRD